MQFFADVKLDKVPRGVVTTPKDPTVAYVINSEEVVVLQEANVANICKLDEPTACAISPSGDILVVGTNAGGAKGGGKVLMYPVRRIPIKTQLTVRVDQCFLFLREFYRQTQSRRWANHWSCNHPTSPL
eukprot:SAG31_NODE_13969_length_834_cov_0.926531_2_plen_129_part_00